MCVSGMRPQFFCCAVFLGAFQFSDGKAFDEAIGCRSDQPCGVEPSIFFRIPAASLGRQFPSSLADPEICGGTG